MIDRQPRSVSSTQEIDADARESTRALRLAAEAEGADRQALANGYRLCAACRMRLVAAELCAYHTPTERVDDWAAGNRIWCEFVHGKWPARQGVTSAPNAEDLGIGSERAPAQASARMSRRVLTDDGVI